MSQFDVAAKTWDENPMHWKRSEAIAQKMMEKIDFSSKHYALEFGAGTAILSFMLQSVIPHITLMDNSVEMVKQMDEKVIKHQAYHLEPLFFDLETDSYTGKKFDLIFTQMAMHHVVDVKAVLTKFYDMLNPNGTIVLADLYAEDGSFHGASFNGHNGFEVDELLQLINKTGFTNCTHEPCYVIQKQTETGVTKDFPLFFITATK